jgi:hypothetical protein
MSEHLLCELVCVCVPCSRAQFGVHFVLDIRVYDRSRAKDTWAQTSKSNAKLAASETEHLV